MEEAHALVLTNGSGTRIIAEFDNLEQAEDAFADIGCYTAPPSPAT